MERKKDYPKIDGYWYDEVKREWVYHSSSTWFPRCIDYANFLAEKYPGLRFKARFAK